MRTNKYFDLVFIAILIILAGTAIYSHFQNDLEFTINNYLAFAALIFVTIFRISGYEKIYRLMFLILVLGTFEIINFTPGSDTLDIGRQGKEFFHICFNPYLFLIWLIYCGINWKIVIHICHTLIKGSSSEQQDERNKMILFYYEKFKICSQEELGGIFNNYSEYPEEAQVALKRIKSENEGLYK